MTNNPTIDGVSREDKRHASVRALHDVMQSVPSASLYSLAEAVLDAGYAPAVERQEAVARCRQSPVKKYLSIELLRSNMKDGDLLYSAPPEVTALKFTIARLEARIAELESGMGEPIYELEYLGEGGGGWVETDKHQFDVTSKLKNFRTRIVFTAPPAPVAVVQFANELIDGAFGGGNFDGGDIQDIGVKHGLLSIETRDEPCGEFCACKEYGFPAECYRKTACLDAAAALNGVKS